MEIRQSVAIAAPTERVFAALLNVEDLASCFPGAELTGRDGDRYVGQLRLKLGSVGFQYGGSVLLSDINEDDHELTLVLEGREAGGQGLVSGAINVKVSQDASGTSQVSLTTVVDISGKAAQFGSSLLEGVAESMVAQFSNNLEHLLLEGPDADGTIDAAGVSADLSGRSQSRTGLQGSARGGAESRSSELDFLSLAAPAMLRRVLPPTLAFLAGFALSRLVRAQGVESPLRTHVIIYPHLGCHCDID